MSTTEENPFAALLHETQPQEDSVPKDLVEEILLFTLRKDKSTSEAATTSTATGANASAQKTTETTTRRALVSLADVIVPDDSDDPNMSKELLGHAIFERLLLNDIDRYLIRGPQAEDCLEMRVIQYLYRAFLACELAKDKKLTAVHKDQCDVIRKLIITNASTALLQPDLFQGQQNFTAQWMTLLLSESIVVSSILEFLVQISETVIKENDEVETLGTLKSIFYPIFGEMQKQLINATTLMHVNQRLSVALNYFVLSKKTPQLGEILIDYITPNPNSKGSAYMRTLIGQMLCFSFMPKESSAPYEFFANVTPEVQPDAMLWQLLATHQEATFRLVKGLLVLSATTKKKMLQWLANCLQANVSRGHIWNSLNQSYDLSIDQNASDAFMTSLTAVLLRLCEPLCEPQMKILMVDPTYCAVPDADRAAAEVSMLKAYEETCLLPIEEHEQRPTIKKYSFVTEIFYMTHKAFELGYRSTIDRYTRITREVENLQRAFLDVVNTDPNNEMAKNLMRMIKEQMQKCLCIRNSLMEPENERNIVKFFEASAIWLTDLALRNADEYRTAAEKGDFSLHQRLNRNLPSFEEIDFVPDYLKCIPENIIDNIVAYFHFSRYLQTSQFIEVYESAHDVLFKMIVLFMGSAKLMKNPHLRAKLAETLEFHLPKKHANNDHMSVSFLSHVFDRHPDRLRVVASLLNVFVSIEMTGQSVQFEQKFNYRRPMYAIMEFLWTKEEHVQCFRKLASNAEANMDAIEPPLFLRFINLLINDAIFLLDESLSNLQQIRQLQYAQARGEWSQLSQTERQQQQSNLHHLGMMTRFDNILGRDTINILKLLTTEIKSIFCHNSMVDRIAAMLNYFLLSLVGPQKEKFRVNNKKEFEFDPAQTVMEICRLYINLSTSDRFCLAVSQDGRSYSDQLFGYAENILMRIGAGQLICDMAEVATKVKNMELQYREEQEITADAPEEYLDPIMSTLMTDPVILPSSKVTVDRCTIARHLLSDQSDPFNRAPLTMDKVIPNVQLREEIEQWIRDKRNSSVTRIES